MKKLELKNRVSLITGASGGIGKAIALKFASEGSKIIVADLKEKEGKETVLAIKENGGDAIFIKVDLSDYNSIEKLIEKSLQNYLTIDILVNNAGISGYIGPVTETPPEEVEKILKVNLISLFLLVKLVANGMKKKSFGRIINISSVAAKLNTPNSVSYNVSKAGVNTFTKSLSKEIASSGITVNAIAPGLVLTERIINSRLPGMAEKQGVSIDEMMKILTEDTHTGNLSTENDIAETALFLASDRAKNITGEIISVAGGI